MGLIGSSYFIGWTATTLIIPPLADKIGRKWIYRICMVIQTLTMFGVVFSKSMDMTIGLITLIGIVTSGRILVGYVYASEFLTNKWRVIFGTLNLVVDGTSTIWSAIYYDFVSKHSIYFELIGCGLAIICTLLAFLFIPESPIWLMKTGKTKDGQESLRYIMKFNKVECEEEIEELDPDLAGDGLIQSNSFLDSKLNDTRRSTTTS